MLNSRFTNLIGIVGISSAIAFAGYSHFNQEAIAQTATPTPNNTPEATGQQNNLSTLDQLYVTEAAQGGMAEVEMAELALKRSKNNNIRQYAQRMIKEHTPVNQQLMKLASQKGITPPAQLSPKYQAVIAQLSQASGNTFDQQYQSEAGVNLHMEYLVVQRRQSEFGQDPDLRAFAVKNIPVAQKHLQEGERLLSQSSR